MIEALFLSKCFAYTPKSFGFFFLLTRIKVICYKCYYKNDIFFIEQIYSYNKPILWIYEVTILCVTSDF